MKAYLSILISALFMTTQIFAANQTLGADKVIIGNKTSVDKAIEFNINAGAANPKIKANQSTNKIQFAQDGVNYKDLGSGSGGGGSGVNVITEPGFESGINVGWTSSGGTYAAITSGINLLYQTTSASFQATATTQYFESTAVVIPQILYGQSCMVKTIYKGGDANLYLTVLDGSSVELIPTTTRATLNAETGIKTAKVYFTCPTSGSMKLRVASTAASAVAFFDETHLGSADFQGVPAISSWTSFIPVSNWVSNTSFLGKWRLVGEQLEVEVSWTNSGAPTAVGLQITLPANFNIDFNKLPHGVLASDSIIGYGSQTDTGINIYPFYVSPSSVNVVAARTANASTSYLTAGATVTNLLPFTVGATDTGNLSFKVPVIGAATSDTAINSKCPNDIACENNFGAQMVVSAQTISNENLDWINGNCTKASVGNFTCTFNSGIFTAVPNCSVTSLAGSGTATSIINTTSGSINFATFITTSGTLTDYPVNINCQKSGADFKAKQNIQGFLASTLTSGLSNLRLEYVSVTTQCTSTPCTIASQSGAITSITRSGVGSYIANFAAGTFSTAPVCWGNSASNLVAQTMSTIQGSNTTTTSNFVTVTSATGSTGDGYFNMFCLGVR